MSIEIPRMVQSLPVISKNYHLQSPRITAFLWITIEDQKKRPFDVGQCFIEEKVFVKVRQAARLGPAVQWCSEEELQSLLSAELN